MGRITAPRPIVCNQLEVFQQVRSASGAPVFPRNLEEGEVNVAIRFAVEGRA